MRVTVNRVAMLDAFNAVLAAVPNKSPKPILMSVKFVAEATGCHLTATDLEIGIRAEVADVDIETPGAVILPANRVASILRVSKDVVFTIETDGTNLLLSGLMDVFELASEDPDLFPELPGFEAETFRQVAAAGLKKIIRRTSFAVNDAPKQVALGGVCFEFAGNTLTGVACDGRRLAQMIVETDTVDSAGEIQGEGAEPLLAASPIVPIKFLKLLDKNIDDDSPPVHFDIQPNSIVVRTQNATIYTRLIEGKFPRYQTALAIKPKFKVDVENDVLRDAVEKAVILTSEESRGVNFHWAADLLKLSSQSANKGRSNIQAKIGFDSGDIKFTMDPVYLLDALRMLPADMTISAEFKDVTQMIIFRSPDNYVYALAPIQEA